MKYKDGIWCIYPCSFCGEEFILIYDLLLHEKTCEEQGKETQQEPPVEFEEESVGC
jgi:hypothetical protein